MWISDGSNFKYCEYQRAKTQETLTPGGPKCHWSLSTQKKSLIDNRIKKVQFLIAG